METQSVNEPQLQVSLPPARRISRFQELGLLIVIVALALVLSLYGWRNARDGRPNTFLNFDNFVAGIATPMSYYAIMAVGMTFVIITGGIDISVGSMMALAAMGAAAVLQDLPMDAPAWHVLPIAIGVSTGIGLLCGLFNGVLIVALRLHPFIVTLGTMSIFRCLVNVIPAFAPKTLPMGGKYLPYAFTRDFMRIRLWGLEPMPLIIMLICVLLGWFYLRLTIAGRENYAVGGNEEAARFSGIQVNRVKLRVYSMLGLACGIAGMVSLGRFGTASSSTANGYELTVIAAAVVGGASLMGGRGTAIGALLGTLIIAMIQNGILITGISSEYGQGITGAAIIIAAALDQFSEYLRKRRLSRTTAHG